VSAPLTIPAVGIRQATASPHNRFADTWLGELPVPFPKNYVLGIDLQQSDFENYGRPSYLRGQWREYGWWYYYLYACAIKVPLGLWFLGFVVLFVRIANGYKCCMHSRASSKRRFIVSNCTIAGVAQGTRFLPTADGRQPTARFRDELILLFPALVIFTVVSAETGFNEHMRYVLPAFPFFFIFTCRIVGCPLNDMEQFLTTQLTSDFRIAYKGQPSDWGLSSTTKWRRQMALLPAALVATLGSWLIASSLWIYPHSLSYFNEAIGGPLNGAEHLLGSNIDWGQDLRYAIQHFRQGDGYRVPLIAWRGYCDPEDLLGLSVDSREKLQVTERTRIVGANFLKGDRHNVRGNFMDGFRSLDEFVADLDRGKEISAIGYSMRVFDPPGESK
jgi:hypothetical protein